MKYLFSILLLSLSAIVHSQDNTWTLEKCIEHAQTNNLSIKQMELNAHFSKNSYKQSKENLLPSLSANSGFNYSVGRIVNQYTNEFTTNSTQSLNMSLSAEVVLFNGLQNINTIKKNKLDMLADQQAIEKVKRDISLELSLAYLLILRNQELLNAAKAQLKTTQQQISRTEKLIKVGNLPEGALYEIQAQEAQEQATIVDAENQLNIATLNLTQLLELPNTTGFAIQKPEAPDLTTEQINFSVEQVYNQIDQLPQIKEAELKLQSAKKDLSIAYGAFSPTLSATASIGTGYSSARQQPMGNPTLNSVPIGSVQGTNQTVIAQQPTYEFGKIPFSDQWRDNQNEQFGIYLRIPIYSRGLIRQRVSNAQVNILSAQTAMDQTKRRVYQSIQQAHADANGSLARFKSSQTAVLAMQKAFEYTHQKHEVGAVNTLEYTQAKNRLFKAQSDLAQSKYDYIFRTKILDFYRGEPLSL